MKIYGKLYNFFKRERERESSEYSEKLINQNIVLNTNNWKWFKLNEIFEKRKIKKYSSIPENLGDIPFITSTEINNGVVKWVDNIKFFPGNVITITTNGNGFKAFYQLKEFGCSTDVEVLSSNKLNKYNAFFLIVLLNKENYKYSYGRKPKNNKVWETKIKLPAILNMDGKYILDWNFMEEYIKSLPYSKFL